MRTSTLRVALAAMALLVILQWSPAARADFTLTGVVGSIGSSIDANPIYAWFKFTDATLTKGCTGNGTPVDNAIVFIGNPSAQNVGSREIISYLLISKKGTTITCVFTNKPQCQVRSCELQ